MAPPSTDDFLDTVDDVLTGGVRDDFGSKKSIKMKMASAPVAGGPITFTNEIVEKKGAFGGKPSMKWKHKESGLSVDKVAPDAANYIGAVNFSLSKLPIDGLSVECKTEMANKKGSVECTYSNDTLYSGLLVKADKGKYKCASADLTMAYDGIQVGGKVSFKDTFDDLWVGIGYSGPSYFVGITAEQMLKGFTLGAMLKATKEVSVACQASSNLESLSEAAAAVAYKHSGAVTLKGRFDVVQNSLAGHVTYKALPKVTMVGGVCIPIASPGDLTYGANLTLG